MRTTADAAGVLALKAGSAVLQFLLLILTARWFGVEARGDIALFNAAVNLVVLVAGFTGGSSIVFLAARNRSRAFLHRLLLASYAFCMLVPVLVGAVSSALSHPLGHDPVNIVTVAALNAMLIVNVCVLLSGSAVWQATLVEFLRPAFLLAAVWGLVLVRGAGGMVDLYRVWSVAAAVAFVASLPFVLAHARRLESVAAEAPPRVSAVVRQLLGLGFVAQASNLVQFLNYRGLFFALERHAGLAAVGVFSTAVALAEVLWIPANSLAAMTLNRVSRGGRDPGTRAWVLAVVRLTLVVMIGGGLVAMVVPVGGITLLLGRDFAQVREQLVRLLPGVVASGVGLIASAYHAGHGRYARNLAAAFAGLTLTAVGFVWLVPAGGAPGALLAMNLSYVATSIVLLVGLVRQERVLWSELVPRLSDLKRARSSPS